VNGAIIFIYSLRGISAAAGGERLATGNTVETLKLPKILKKIIADGADDCRFPFTPNDLKFC